MPLTLHDTLPFKDRPRLFLDGPDSLAALADSPDLEVLVLRHFPKIGSLEPLRALAKLRYLSLSTTPGWDGTNRHLRVASFEPLASLAQVELLEIIGVVPDEGRLEPLTRMPSLRRVSIGNTNFYQLEDFAGLSVKLPLARASVQPICQMNFISTCRRCGVWPLLFLEGAKPRSPAYVCPSCGKRKIAAHLERWNQAGGVPRYESPSTFAPQTLLQLFGNASAR